MAVLDDGMYEVVIVDADERDDGVIALEVAITSGPRRGEMIRIAATGLRRHWADLLAAPATLVVTAGEPRLTLD